MQTQYPINATTGSQDPTLVWTTGNPATGTEGSYPPAELMWHPQTEIINVITAAGITPSDADLSQLLEAIRQLIAAAIAGVMYGPTINGGLALDSSQDFLLNFNNLIENDDPQSADLFAYESVSAEQPVKITFAKLVAAIGEVIGSGTTGGTGQPGQNGTNATNIQTCVSNSNPVGIQSSVATQVAHWGTTANTFTTSTFNGQYFTVGNGEDGYFLLTASVSLNIVCYDMGWEITINGVRSGIRSGNGSEAQATAAASVAGVRHLNVGDQVGVYCYLETGGANRTFPACNFAISRIRGN